MDALCQGIEAFVSAASSAITDINASEAIRPLSPNLVLATNEPDEIRNREAMMSASMFAGLAFSNASSRPVHSMANRLGGFYDPPHGDRIAKTLSHVISYDCPFARERYRAIESFMTGAGPVTKDGPGRPAGTAGRNVAPFGDGGWLSEMGVKEEDIPFPVDSALRDPFHLTNPRPFEKREIGAILRCTVNRSPEWRYAGDGLSWS